MRYLELRIMLPLDCDKEMERALLYAIMKTSQAETRPGEGVEVVENEIDTHPEYGKGQRTLKKYHLGPRLPGFVRAFAPKSALVLEERAWNCFPYCMTALTNPYMGKDMTFTLETKYVKDDFGEQENIFNLDKDVLAKREVHHIDILQWYDGPTPKPHTDNPEYDEAHDPTKYRSKKAKRGPLAAGWHKTQKPMLCVYKLVAVEFKWWGVQTKVESFIVQYEIKLLAQTHAKMYTLMDEWFDLSMKDIRRMEDEAAAKTNKHLKTGGGGADGGADDGGTAAAAAAGDDADDADADDDDDDDDDDDEADEDDGAAAAATTAATAGAGGKKKKRARKKKARAGGGGGAGGGGS